jgi:hypothetical protein
VHVPHRSAGRSSVRGRPAARSIASPGCCSPRPPGCRRAVPSQPWICRSMVCDAARVWQRRPAGACRAATTTLLLLLAAPSRASIIVRIACADGGGDLVQTRGRTLLSEGFCDADHACDGICTFAFDPACPACLANQLSRGRDICSPDGYAESCPGIPAPPCPSGLPHIVLPLGPKGHAHKRIHFKLANEHFTFLLRCEVGRSCSAPPQSPPPGFPDVSGDWTLQETTTNTDCAPIALTDFQPSGTIRIVQNGVGLTACIDPAASAQGGFSPIGEGVVSGSTLSVSAGLAGYNGVDTYMLSLVAALPTSGMSTTASEQWSFRKDVPSMTPVCTRTATATMSRLPMPPCTTDDQCISMDPCMRCNGALRCALSPLCQ